MHSLDIKKENKLDISKVSLLLTIQMGVFSNLKKMKIGFNLKPFSKSKNLQNKKSEPSKEKSIDLHLETIKKIDEIIEQHKKELTQNRFESNIQENISLQDIEEIREPTLKSPEILSFGEASLEVENITRELDQREEFFEIESPLNFSPNFNDKQEKDFQNWMIGDQDKKTRNSFWNLSKIKVRKKENKTYKQIPKKDNEKQKSNNLTKTKLELEETKLEIEKKKKALEEAIKKEKQKEIELEQERKKNKKHEKLKRLELKKKLREQKIKEKETKKTEKEKQKKLELQKKLKEKETLKTEKELQQKRKQEEKKKQEKLKELELQKKLKEKETLKAEKELQQKRKQEEKKKQEKLKELELQKKLKEKHKKKKTDEQETIQPELQEPADLGTHIEEKKEPVQEPISLDEDVEKLLPILDNLFANLPDNIVDEFTQSKDFKLYEKVMLKYTSK